MGLKKKNLLGKETAVPFPTASGAVRSKPKTSDPYRVALLIPMCGTAGMWGPSCIASAEVALKELNAHDGINDRPVEIVVLDSAVEADTPIELVIADKIKHGNIDAMVGMHISAVRQKIAQTVRGKIPFVYTPLYEGGEMSPGVFTIGDTPARQLAPAIGHMSQKFRLKKWALIGNDYVWPRVSHAFAKIELHRHQIEMVYENYLPFSSDRLADAVENIGNSGADAILLSLVGQDAVEFNRIFGAMNLSSRMFRLSCAIEENGLLASGEKNLDRLFSSASYFAGLNTQGNADFREKYHNLHQERAPMLNAMGQSTYEGLHFLARLVGERDTDWHEPRTSASRPISYKSARRGLYITNSQDMSPVYLARANGYVFDDLQQLP